MDNQSIAKILRDFGDDYAGAAEWVRRELTDAKHDQFLADKIAYAEQLASKTNTIGYIQDKWDDCKAQVTAAEEQVAEITRKYKVLRDSYYELRDGSAMGMRGLLIEAIGLIGCVDRGTRAKQALSAAPKRGRVLFQGEGFFARVPPDNVGMWHCVDGTVTVDFLREIEAKDDQLLEVTMREAAVNDNLALCKPVRCEYHVGPPWPDPRGGDCGQPVEYLVEWGDESRWYVCGEHATSIEEAE